MDRRVINNSYSLPPMQLFANLANLCLTVTPEEGAPNAPFLVPGSDKTMIGQVWGESPPTGGVVVYFSLAENGEDVHLWDPEVQDEAPEDCPPLHIFKLAEMDEFIAKWLVGDA